MITAVLYLWFAANGQLPFEPWWVVGLLFMAVITWNAIRQGEPLFNVEVERQ